MVNEEEVDAAAAAEKQPLKNSVPKGLKVSSISEQNYLAAEESTMDLEEGVPTTLAAGDGQKKGAFQRHGF